jgi:hypothetical protein
MVSWSEFNALEKRVAEMENGLRSTRANVAEAIDTLNTFGRQLAEAVKMVGTTATDMGALGRRVATLEIQPAKNASDAAVRNAAGDLRPEGL